MFVCSFIFLVTETITNLLITLITCLWSESKPFRKERRAEKKRERENQETSERERDREIEREEERERGTVNKHTQLMVAVLVDTG